MGERKILNKHYPVDFDPAVLPPSRKWKNKQMKVRTMVPFSVRCTNCGEYIGAGKKFNSRKETTKEDYLGIKIHRFYLRCTRCCNEITIKTDPKHADYTAEHGAVRNYESQLKKESQLREQRQKDKEETENNAMKAIESKVLDTRAEMDTLDALLELRSQNARANNIDPMDILEHLTSSVTQESIQAEEQELLQLVSGRHSISLPDEPMERKREVSSFSTNSSRPRVSKIGARNVKQLPKDKHDNLF